VRNSPQGVFIEVEGQQADLSAFLLRLEREKPRISFIQSLESSFLDPVGYGGFGIRASEETGTKTALVMPDVATCPECLKEINDPVNRRYRYPFTNCTDCGPRFSIVESLPYDRPNTTMKEFRMCGDCRSEYEDPADRRFHAQPNACPVCGPQLELWDSDGRVLASRDEALLAAANLIRQGAIVAVKGLGGFHLMVDARNEEAVRRLRDRKHREEKPLALMFPSLEALKPVCEVGELEERLLLSPECPIVLLPRRAVRSDKLEVKSERVSGIGYRVSGDSERSTVDSDKSLPDNELSEGSERPAGLGLRVTDHALRITDAPSSPPSTINHQPSTVSSAVAPGNPCLGAMLPYTPLHHLLMAELGFPVVATSGNLSDEPICTDEKDALGRLKGIAEYFLVHNRPIARHVDDSIVRVLTGRELVLRRARGYAPLPVAVKGAPEGVLAVGAHLKNSVAVSVGEQVFISQHIGDLDTAAAFHAFCRTERCLRDLYGMKPQVVVCDAHPDYASTQFAREQGLPVVPVQHHYAHVRSCMAENDLEPPVLGVSWDGTGFGTDGTVWGGEFLEVDERNFLRRAHFRCFRLPGGDRAAKEPRRSALGLLYELLGDEVFRMDGLPPVQAFTGQELKLLRSMLERGLNAPVTSSAGRLFDAVASILGIRQHNRFEGQAAMELEFAAAGGVEESYPVEVLVCGTEEEEACRMFPVGQPPAVCPSRPFRPSRPSRPPSKMLPTGQAPSEQIVDWGPMIRAILCDIQDGVPASVVSAKFHNTLPEAIVSVAQTVGRERVVLTGGCFQNRVLAERAISRLQLAGFRPYWHQRVPPNDGGISLGQVAAAAAGLR
jgi:hydrogenase maturation protein HypF